MTTTLVERLRSANATGGVADKYNEAAEAIESLEREVDRLNSLSGPSGKSMHELEQINDDLCEKYEELERKLAERDAEIARLSEHCRDFASQAETDAGIIKSDGKEIHYLRQQIALLREALVKVVVISDRKHDAWDELNAKLKAARGHMNLYRLFSCEGGDSYDPECAEKNLDKVQEILK